MHVGAGEWGFSQDLPGHEAENLDYTDASTLMCNASRTRARAGLFVGAGAVAEETNIRVHTLVTGQHRSLTALSKP